MKTKQEQIEEMAVIGCVRNPQAHTAEECAKCDFKQAQTDVLNKLKTNLSKSDDFMDICSWHIDKLIKEVEQ